MITINMVLMTVLAPIVFGLYLWALRTGMLLYKQARSGYVGSLFVWLCQYRPLCHRIFLHFCCGWTVFIESHGRATRLVPATLGEFLLFHVIAAEACGVFY